MTAPTPDSAPESTDTVVDDVATQPGAENEAADSTEGDAWDEAAAKRKFERMKADLDKVRQERDKYKPLAAEAEKARQASLSAEQKLQEQLAEREKELDKLHRESVVRDAAEAVDLPAGMRKFITATDPDAALAQAKELVELVKGNAPKPDLKQGARGTKQPTARNSEDNLRSLFR